MSSNRSRLFRVSTIGVLLFTGFTGFVPFLSGPSPILEAQAGGTRIYRLLVTEWTEYVLSRTPQGRRISELLIGRPVADPGDFSDLRSRLTWMDAESQQIRWELESRLLKVEREFQRRRMDRTLRERIVDADHALLDDLAGHFLVPEPRLLEQGRLQFTRARGIPFQPRASARAFAEARPRHGGPMERDVPVERGSIESALPARLKVYDRLVELETRYGYEYSLFDLNRLGDELQRAARSSRVTVKDVVDQVIRRRNQLASELEVLSVDYRNVDSELSRILSDAADKIRFNEGARRRYGTKTARYSGLAFDPNLHVNEISGYASILNGVFGELRVGVRVGGVQGRGLSVAELERVLRPGPFQREATQRLRTLFESNPQVFQKELDLVMGDGRIWSEVKYYPNVLSGGSQWKSVKKQAELTLRIKEALEAEPAIMRALGGPIELRIYIVNGVRPSVAARLEEMGFQVFGKVGRALSP